MRTTEPQPHNNPRQKSPSCSGSCAEPSHHLLCITGQGTRVLGPHVAPALEQLRHGHSLQPGECSWVKRCRETAENEACASVGLQHFPSPSTRLCCHPVALPASGSAGWAWQEGGSVIQHPPSLAGAKPLLPRPISSQLEPPTSSSLSPPIQNVSGCSFPRPLHRG